MAGYSVGSRVIICPIAQLARATGFDFLIDSKPRIKYNSIERRYYYAYYGSPEEGKGILSNFPSVNDIIEEYQLEKIAIGSGK